MIVLKNLSKKFGEQVVLNSVNLHIKRGENTLIMGQNGAGKSTLIKAILAQIHCQGEVKIMGINPFLERKKALENVAFVPQSPPPLRLKISELCEYALKVGKFELKTLKNALNMLEFSYEKEQNKVFTTLSGGMKQKLLIAIALAKNAPIVLFDEPTANLDPMAREQFLTLLSKSTENRTLLFISHRIDEVKKFTHKILEMDFGKIISEEKI